MNKVFGISNKQFQVHNSIGVRKAQGLPQQQLSQRKSLLTIQRKNIVNCQSEASVLTPALRERIDKIVNSHTVVAFIKGTRLFPQCGFSNTVVQVLNAVCPKYETVDVLDSEQIRLGMKEYSQWPTFPQIYIDGEFYGGCDILLEELNSGNLQETIEVAMNS